LIKRPQQEKRVRLAEDQTMSTLSHLELLKKYWQAKHVDDEEITTLQNLAGDIIQGESEDEPT
jgi:hypothetical protein